MSTEHRKTYGEAIFTLTMINFDPSVGEDLPSEDFFDGDDLVSIQAIETSIFLADIECDEIEEKVSQARAALEDARNAVQAQIEALTPEEEAA